jgi:hypothetical protein
LSQTSFQRRAWSVAENARSSSDRADARILMRMIELVDCGDYDALEPLAKALQAEYRTLPASFLGPSRTTTKAADRVGPPARLRSWS